MEDKQFLKLYKSTVEKINIHLDFLNTLEKQRLEYNKKIIRHFLINYSKTHDFNIEKVGYIDATEDLYISEYSLNIISHDNISIDHIVRIETHIENILNNLIIKKPSYCDDLTVLINKYEEEFSDFGKEIKL